METLSRRRKAGAEGSSRKAGGQVVPGPDELARAFFPSIGEAPQTRSPPSVLSKPLQVWLRAWLSAKSSPIVVV